MIYTPKQRRLMRLWQTNKLKRINILEGSVSSGKTWVSLVLWAFWVHEMPDAPDHLYLMSARSLTTLKRNCLLLLQSLVGESNFRFSMSAKEGWLFGRHILFEGANDAQAEAKIRGVTLQGAYVDEATKLPEDFFAMLLSRLRKPGAKLIATTNPDYPGHWLKAKYIDRADELDLFDMPFVIDDNTTLPSDYVENIKKEYTGVFYDRFILGLWVLAEGIIYPMYEEAIAEPPEGKASAYCLSIDYGTQNAFAALMWGKYDDIWYAVDEYYYSGRKKGIQKTDEEYAQDIDAFVKPYTDGRLETIIDPSAASFITALQKRGGYRVRHAINDVADGIRETATALKKGLIRISPRCENWKKESQGYVWDDSDQTEDKPVKEADHCLVGETLVNTKDGAKPISELVGTSGEVWSYNTDVGVAELKPYRDCRLTQEKAEIYEIETEDGRFIRCTGEHPILTERGYVVAENISQSDRIFTIWSERISVVSVRKIGTANVYNMEVENNHNFAVEGGLIVHNCMDSMRYFVKTKHIAIPKKQMPGSARTVLL